MDFFGMGISEFFIIVFFCLIFFKPEELPTIVRAIVTHVKKFRSMTTKVKKDIGDIYHREIESKFEEAKEQLEKETFEFRSKLASEYEDINHQLTQVQKEIDITQEIKKVVEEKSTEETPQSKDVSLPALESNTKNI